MYSSTLFGLLVAMGFASLQFTAADAVRWRAALLATVGAVGICTVLPITPTGIVVLAVAAGVVLFGLRRISALGGNAGIGLLLLVFAPLLLSWVAGKLALAMDWPRLAPLLFVGSSYLLVKTWSLLKDIKDGKVRDPDPIQVAAFLLHLPTFSIGPMHYFGEFQSQLRNPYVLDMERGVDLVFRFVLGLVKVNVVASLLAPRSLLGIDEAGLADPLRLISAAVVYSVVLYCDFSGYCDMAIAVSRLLGVDVPENFNRPFLASSIREFWRRWHITFSRALTAHVFVPLTRTLQGYLPASPGRVAALGYLGTFLFCGYWHGATANFLLWGLWHALGLVVQDAWSRWRRARGAKPAVHKGSARLAIDTAATFAFVSLGWIFFVLPVDKLWRIWGM